MFDCVYAIGGVFDFSISGVPANAFNELVHATSRLFVDYYAEEPQNSALKDVQAIELRTLEEIAGQVAKQCNRPRIVRHQSLEDESVSESIITEPVLVLGGINSLLTYIMGTPAVLKDEPIWFYNLSGQPGADQTLTVEGFKCRVSTPNQQVFILWQ